MRTFSAQYIITNSGPPLKRALINTHDNGTIISIENTDGELKEKHSVEYHNGIIIPGFVNCHCHLELSHMKSSIEEGSGLGDFILQVRNTRENNSDNILKSAYIADSDMYNEGVDLCADICNTPVTFEIRAKSRIKYINLLEVFGIDPDKAEKRINELDNLADAANDMGLNYSMVPHSAYSTSLKLFNLLLAKTKDNKVTSIHFMETPGEKIFIENHSGPLMTSYKLSGLLPERLDNVTNHTDLVMNHITRSGNLILVHNTFADQNTIRMMMKRQNLFWCLCPNSNIFIENQVPPLDTLMEEGCDIVIGTDSLASNKKLSILDELKTLQFNFPEISVEDLVKWSTINGAKALGVESDFGKIEAGKKPGLLLLQNVDLQSFKLLPGTTVTRLA